MRLQAAGQRD